MQFSLFIIDPNVQECDATKAQFISYSPAQTSSSYEPSTMTCKLLMYLTCKMKFNIGIIVALGV